MCTQYSTSTSHPFTSENKKKKPTVATQNSPRLSRVFPSRSPIPFSLATHLFDLRSHREGQIETWVNQIEFKYITENERLEGPKMMGLGEKVDSFEIWPLFGIYVRFLLGVESSLTATCGFASDPFHVGTPGPRDSTMKALNKSGTCSTWSTPAWCIFYSRPNPWKYFILRYLKADGTDPA